MDIELATVAVILKALGVPLSVDSKDDRISMQKAIYLTQVRARDLGYRFRWYLNGPYSTELADIYYKAAAQISDYERYNADSATVADLYPVIEATKAKPIGSSLADWLEALASLDFLMRGSKRSLEDAREACKRLKPHLAGLFDDAGLTLAANGFV